MSTSVRLTVFQYLAAIVVVGGLCMFFRGMEGELHGAFVPLLMVVVVGSAGWGGLGPGIVAAGSSMVGVLTLLHLDGKGPPLVAEATALLSLLLVAMVIGFLHRGKTRANQALQERDTRVRLLSEQIPGGLWSTNTELELTSGFGAQSEPLIGALGMSLFELYRTQDPQFPPIAAHRRALAGESCRYELSWQGRTFQCQVEPLRNREGEIIGVVGVGSDITERKKAEQDLRRTQGELERANHAKDHFLAMLSHELRTPLTPVLALTSSLRERGDLPGDVQEDLDTIQRNAELEARLIDDLLDLTRVARGKLQLHLRSVDVHETLRRAVDVCRHESEDKGVLVDVELGAARHTIRGDAARLQQVFWNLLKNAIKFTPAGGRVCLRTGQTDAGHLRIEVSDTGIGIDSELLPRIFDAFEQGGEGTTRKFGGLGLGLAISKALVEAMGGKIWATSTGRGQGASFIVELTPVTATEPATAQDGPSGHAPIPGVRVLVVEDHADTAWTMARLLQRAGYEVTTAGSVAQALTALEERGTDILISDLGLPDGSGLDLMRQATGRFAVRGIALSGFGTEADVQQSLAAGFSVHLTKPVAIDLLRQALADLVRDSIVTASGDRAGASA